MIPGVIFIDWYGTLSDSKFWGHLQGSPQYNLIENSLFKHLNHLIGPWMRGNFSTEEIIEIISENTKLDQEFLLGEFIISCQNMIVPKSIFRQVKELREKSKKVFIATDNMDSFTRWTATSLSLDNHFDGVLNSYDIKALKEEFSENGKSLFFSQFLAKNNIDPQECILIDDSTDVDNRINSFGIQYLKIEKSSELEEILSKLTPR